MKIATDSVHRKSLFRQMLRYHIAVGDSFAHTAPI